MNKREVQQNVQDKQYEGFRQSAKQYHSSNDTQQGATP
jgi:hypothetical protein